MCDCPPPCALSSRLITVKRFVLEVCRPITIALKISFCNRQATGDMPFQADILSLFRYRPEWKPCRITNFNSSWKESPDSSDLMLWKALPSFSLSVKLCANPAAGNERTRLIFTVHWNRLPFQIDTGFFPPDACRPKSHRSWINLSDIFSASLL